jgi:hypothetical protein
LKISADKNLAKRSESDSYVFAWPISLQQRTKTVFIVLRKGQKRGQASPGGFL